LLFDSANCTVLCAVVLTQYWRVTDRRTDGQTDGVAVASTALAISALRRAVKKVKKAFPYSIPSVLPQQAWAENWAAAPPFWGGCGSPSNKVPWAEAYVRTKWHLDPCGQLAATDMGRNLGAVPPWGKSSWVPICHNVAYLRA